MEIGSVFPLTLAPALATNFRCALHAIIEAKSPKRIVLPDYFCPSILKLFPGPRYKVTFEIGQPHCTDLDLKTGDLVVVVNYFGFKNESFWKNDIPEGITVVEDMSMSFYLPPEEASDFWIYNLRKFFPLPDGALVFSHTATPLKLHKDPPEVWWSSNLQAMTLRKGGQDKELWYKMFQIGKAAVPFGPYKMSDYSTKRLGLIHDPIAANVRHRNYQHLSRWLQPMLYPLTTEAPLGFPIRTTKAEEISKAMAEKGVFVPLMWPGQDVIMLPCDQRYQYNDMEQVAKVFKECR